uniref:Uncharacterized protein n=1 Tax=Cryptomonas curvata TaxID=233186 RepID=A0A7S0M9Q1_9CRYP|mmetsp:Transcript_2713/g.5807  ORF Transcript_2713/g.5807 Transcript_2713/m.5807 type:complete len:104 (+) Transcript_2713:523-834(+)
MAWQDSPNAIILMNCYKYRIQILKSGLFEIMKQPPFPGLYKTRESEDLETVRQAFHLQYGIEPISIMRFLDFLADIGKERGDNIGHKEHGEGRGQGGYGFDSD